GKPAICSDGARGNGGGGFFFQAEDGIRDFHVTGVQTCALPILDAGVAGVRERDDLLRRKIVELRDRVAGAGVELDDPIGPFRERSEARRAGKESRSGWQPQRKKQQRKEAACTTLAGE